MQTPADCVNLSIIKDFTCKPWKCHRWMSREFSVLPAVFSSFECNWWTSWLFSFPFSHMICIRFICLFIASSGLLYFLCFALLSFFLFLFLFFWTTWYLFNFSLFSKSHFVIAIVLEFEIYTRLSLNLQRSAFILLGLKVCSPTLFNRQVFVRFQKEEGITVSHISKQHSFK